MHHCIEVEYLLVFLQMANNDLLHYKLLIGVCFQLHQYGRAIGPFT